MKQYVPELEKGSKARVSQSKDFAYLLEDISEVKKRKDEKTISLNEKIRGLPALRNLIAALLILFTQSSACALNYPSFMMPSGWNAGLCGSWAGRSGLHTFDR